MTITDFLNSELGWTVLVFVLIPLIPITIVECYRICLQLTLCVLPGSAKCAMMIQKQLAQSRDQQYRSLELMLLMVTIIALVYVTIRYS